MIYLRPSRRITSLGEGDPLLEGVDILEEYLQELQREHNPFTIVIESEHGSDLDKEGVRDTVLHLRIYGHDGSDLTDLLPADFAPEWYRGETQVGVGMSLALTWQDVKTYSQVYSVTLTAWRIYKALPTQAPIEPAIQRLLRDISCRGEFILQGSIRFAHDQFETVARSLREELEKKLNASDFDSFKAGDFKTASDRLSRAERALSSYLSELEKKLNASDFDSFKAGDFKTASDRLTRAERALSSYLTELEKKLNASDFDSFKGGDFKSASDRLTSAERALSSHTSELQKKLDASDFDSFKGGDFKSASDRLASAERALKSQASELEKKLDTSAFNSLAELVHELPTSSTVYEMLLNQASSTYSVRVFTTGQIRNGKMDVANPTDPTTQQPAVLHSALACNLLSGQAAADFYDSLKWTVNKGRTTEPLERTTTGSLCYVLAQDIVHPSDGSAPYYDIQLERLT